MTIKLSAVAAFLILAGVAQPAVARPIDVLVPPYSEESFENMDPLPETTLHQPSGVLIVAGNVVRGGVTILANGSFVNDYSLSTIDPQTSLSTNGLLGSGDQLPNGDAALNGPVRLLFSQPVYAVGVFAAAVPGDIVLEARDAAGLVIETRTYTSPTLADIGNHPYGITDAQGRIRELLITAGGRTLIIDAVRFASAPPLVDLEDEPAGPNCPTAGVRIESGLDTDADGSLLGPEIETTRYVCNGPHGEDGARSLVTVTSIEPGSACANGGQRLDAGIDDDGDGVLDEEEIDSSTTVCNGAAGTDGAKGTDGIDGTDGAKGTDGIDGTDGAKGTDGIDGTDGMDGAKGTDGDGGCSITRASRSHGSLLFSLFAAALLMGRRRRG